MLTQKEKISHSYQQSADGKDLLQNFKILLEESINSSEEKRFEPLVQYLMNNLCLVADSSKYRIVECEVYYHDSTGMHEDKNTHQKEEQLSAGSWYFNDFGLDITIGNKEKGIYGGILIRSLRCLSGEVRYINGPSCILRELFSQMGSIFSQSNKLYFENDSEGLIQDKEVYRTTRYNLAKEDEDFKGKDYRFVAELNPQNKVPGKEALVRKLYKEKRLASDKVMAMLGYNLK